MISEVYYDTVGNDSYEEYVEIYNGTNQSVDLTGYTLRDNVGTFTIPSGTLIGSGQHLVVARDAAGFQALFGFTPDVSGMTLSFSNSGDQVILEDPAKNELDFVAFEGYVTGWNIEAKTGDVIFRSDLALDNDIVTDWAVGSPSPKN